MTAAVSPITRVEVIHLAVPDTDRNDLDGTTDTALVKIWDDAGRCGFGETDAPPEVIRRFITMPTAHLWSRNMTEVLIGAVIGLTVVAAGTSSPELVVSVSAALRGAADFASGACPTPQELMQRMTQMS